MTRIQDVKVGDPMGFKVNVEGIPDEVVLSSLVASLSTYHGGKYVMGMDTMYCDKNHWHIHWFSAKEVTANALKVFRSTLKKKYTWLSKSDKLYTGQDLPSADKDYWIAYAIKEVNEPHGIASTTDIEVTPRIKTLAASILESKRQKKVISEKKANDEKAAKKEREEMYEYVIKNMPDYQSIGSEYYGDEQMAFECTVIKYKMSQIKFGCIKKHFLAQYYLEYKCHYAQEKWDEIQVYKYIHSK